MTANAGAAEPITGRSGELAELVAAFDQSVAGEARMVFISGEPGIGKTWLLDRFAEHVRAAGGVPLHGNCYEDAAMVPYAPFVEALRDLTRSGVTTSTDGSQASPDSTLTHLVPGLEHGPNRDPGTLDHTPGREQRLEMFDSVTRALAHPAGSRTVVLLLDDLHWADEPSALLLRYVARSLRATRFMIVGAYRDTDLDATQPFESVLRDLQRERIARRIALHRLNTDETRLMIAQLLETDPGSISAAALSRIHHESEGVPFFVEELILHLREDRLLVQAPGGQWALAEGADTAIPQSVRSVVGHRLDHISRPAREALSVAAVIGKEFSFDVLLEVLGERNWEYRDHLLDYIDEAMVRRLVVERQVMAGDTRVHFMFAHEQIHAVLYAGLNAIRRRALHQMAGAAIEHLEPDPARVAARLAYHFTRGEDLHKATRYSVLAAEQAAKLRATGHAIHHYDSALEILDLIGTGHDGETSASDERFRILLSRDVMLESTNQRDRQARGISRLLESAAAADRTDWRFEAQLRAARFDVRGNDLLSALDHTRRAAQLAETLDDTMMKLRAGIAAAEAHIGRLSGEPSRLDRSSPELAAAVRHLTSARELAEALERENETAWITQEMGVVLWALAAGDDTDAQSRARSFLIEALEGFRASNDRKGEITALIALAYRRPVSASSASGPIQGSYVAFLEEIRRLRQTEHLLTRESDRPRMEALSLLSIHTYSRTHGWYETAIDRGQDALEWAATAKEGRVTLLARLGLSETERLIGRPARALEHANHAAAVFETGLASGSIRSTQQEDVLGAQAAAHLALGSVGRAEELARQRLALASARGRKPALAEATITLTEILMQAGDCDDEATRCARETLKHAADLPGTITWDIRALVALAQLALRQNDAATALDQASAAASRVEARETMLTWLVTDTSLTMGLALEAAGHIGDATKWFSRSLELVEHTASHIASDSMRSTYLAACPFAVAVQQAAARHGITIPSSTSVEPPDAQLGGLTSREREVLSLVAAGKTNRELSDILFISEKTVARHLTNIFNKIDAESRTQAAGWAFRHGLA